MTDTALLFEQAAPASLDLVLGGDVEAVPLGPNDLLFERTGNPSTHLVFGDDPSLVVTAAEITITGAFPALTALVKMYPVAEIAITGAFPQPVLLVNVTANVKLIITGTFPPLQAVAEVSYSSNTSRPDVAQLTDTAQIGTAVEWGVAQPQQHALPQNSGAQTAFTEAQLINAGMQVGFDDTRRQSSQAEAGFADAAQLPAAQTRETMQEGDRQWLKFFSQFKEADRLAAERLQGVMQDGIRDYTDHLRAPFAEAQRLLARKYTGRAGAGVPTLSYLDGWFQAAQVPFVGVTLLPVVPVVPLPYWGTELVFACPPGSAALVFGALPCYPAAQALLYILPARFYMTAHTIFAQTLPGLVDVPIFDATVSADAGSYCWSLSASGPASLMEQLAPVAGLPAQIKLTLDGIPWVFAVDSITRAKEFGKSGVRIQGRSLTALIAAPYLRATTRANALAQTAQQLAEDALSGTGIALDWGVGSGALANGGMIDWLVSAGAWSHSGTPLDAVQAIVQAAGGYLQSHRSAATLLARHPYGQRVGDTSGAPWAWSTGNADVELALDAIITEAIERRDGADINAVYVSGTTQGVLGLVKRTGSAGDKLAQMITDPLITHADAARQRGLSVLGAAGHKYAINLDLPVLTGLGQPGVLDVGQLVQINAAVPWRARVRGVTVNAKQPTLRQTVTLERHLETV